MTDYEFILINSDDVKQKLFFELLLFKAFTEQSPGSWTKEHYNFDSISKSIEHKLVTLDEMHQYVAMRGGTVIGGASINLNTKRITTFETIGLNILKDAANNTVAEILNLFILQEFWQKFPELLRLFSSFIFSDLKKKGYKYLYGKCPKKLLKIYRQAGFEEVASYTFKGASQYLIKAVLNR